MLTLNVGPSKISEAVKQDINDAVQLGILEISHRSSQFSQISQEAIEGLREFFRIPQSYRIFYTSSATEAIELAVANTCNRSSFHFVNGNFSKLFGEAAHRFQKEVQIDEVSNGNQNDFKNAKIENADFISVEHNETSTGVMCSMEDIQFLREAYPESILAVDITSSAGGAEIAIESADIWVFSVQKCFGLPAGLGILIVSDPAFETSKRLTAEGKNLSGLFSFESMWSKMDEKYQTIQTPNVLGVFLLSRLLKRWNEAGGMKHHAQETEEKIKMLDEIISKQTALQYFVKKPENRSKTVVVLEGEESQIQAIHKEAEKQNILLGKGYGKIKNTTLRIANFPAIEKKDFTLLENIFL